MEESVQRQQLPSHLVLILLTLLQIPVPVPSLADRPEFQAPWLFLLPESSEPLSRGPLVYPAVSPLPQPDVRLLPGPPAPEQKNPVFP